MELVKFSVQNFKIVGGLLNFEFITKNLQIKVKFNLKNVHYKHFNLIYLMDKYCPFRL